MSEIIKMDYSLIEQDLEEKIRKKIEEECLKITVFEEKEAEE